MFFGHFGGLRQIRLLIWLVFSTATNFYTEGPRDRRLHPGSAMDVPDREDSDSDGVFSPSHGTVENCSTWSYLRNAESCPTNFKCLRRRSTSFVAVQSALFQLSCLEDFALEMIGEGFFAKVYKVILACRLIHCK